MTHHLRSHLPRIGMRITKSAAAAGIAILIYYLLGFDRLPLFIVMAALECMQPYHSGLKEVVQENVGGLFIGAFWALVVILLQRALPMDPTMLSVWQALLIAFGIAASLYTAVVFNCVNAASFSAILFLVIVGVRVDEEDPVFYVARRLIETLVGIGVGTAINAMHLPRRKRKDTLFAVSMDEVLNSEISHLPDYAKVEMNRIMAEGISLTLMTRHSAASLREAGSGIQFKLPVILMDGAAIFDPTTDRYLDKAEISYEDCCEIKKALNDMDISVFTSIVWANAMLIFYEKIRPDAQEIFERLRRSPYRNYIQHPVPEDMKAINITAIGTKQKILRAYDELMTAGFGERFRLLCYELEDNHKYAYMRLISLEADRHEMLRRLQERTGLEHCVSFGKDPELYDVVVNASEGESILKALRREAEPLIWKKQNP